MSNKESNKEPISTFLQLEGKKIARVHLHGINCVTLETECGERYMIETVCVLPTLGLYGMEVTKE
jgi:hypothetical protein